jgi:flagellar basal-body rod protein FlgB
MKLLGLMNQNDSIQMDALNFRLKRSEVINANVANAETPGYRALAYDFESQLQALGEEKSESAVATNSKHRAHPFTTGEGKAEPEVYVRPTETVGNDGNTVDLDAEMSLLAQNQLLYRATVETLSKKIGLLRYAVNGGRG